MKAGENPGGKLKALCEAMGDFFDFIVVDSEPGMSAVMVNATIAADMIIIPVSCMDALEGASEGVFGIMEKNGLSTDYYFLQTFYDEKQASSRNIRERLLEDADGNYFNTRIKRNEWLNKAGEMGMDIFELMPKTAGATGYKELASEVIGKFKKKAQ
jgi:chromosome partitioning protein